MALTRRPKLVVTDMPIQKDSVQSGYKAVIIGPEPHSQAIGYSAENMGVLHKDVTSDKIESIFCKGSSISRAGLRYKDFDINSRLDMIALKVADAAVAARGWINIKPSANNTGATQGTILRIYVYDKRIFKEVEVVKGDTGKAIVDKIHESLKDFLATEADPKMNLFSEITVEEKDATTHEGQITIRSAEKGKYGDGLKIHIEGGKDCIPGCITTISNFDEGSGVYTDNTDLSSHLTEDYDVVIFDHNIVRMQTMSDFMHTQANSSLIDLRGWAINVRNNFGADALILDVADIPKNHKRMWTIADIPEHTVIADPLTLSAEIASKVMNEQTEGADASGTVTNVDDYIGGIQNASLPYFGIEVECIPFDSTLTEDKEKKLNDAGLSVLQIRNGRVYTGEAFTTYSENNSGVADNTYKYLSTVLTADRVNAHVRSNFEGSFKRIRLDKNTKTNVVNTCMKIFQYLVDKKLVLDVHEETNLKNWFRDNVMKSYVVDYNSGGVSVRMPFILVGQIRKISILVQHGNDPGKTSFTVE